MEEPDIAPSSRGFSWLLRFGDQVQTAIGQFAVRSLARSRQHRLIVAFYLGIGLALTIPLGQLWHDPIGPVLAASVLMTVLATAGMRIAFALPLELPANWIFCAIGVAPGSEVLVASRRVLLFLSVVPVWLGSAGVILLKSWPWREAADHLLVLALLGMILVDLTLYGFHKIPFACSYLPGKLPAHMVFLAAVGLLIPLPPSVMFERRVLGGPRATIAMIVLCVGLAVGVRWRATASAREDQGDLQFEEVDSSAPLELGLSRDGGIAGTRER